MNKTLVLLVGAILLWPTGGFAGLVLTADFVTTPSDSTVGVTYYAADDDGATGGVAELTGFDITFDIGNDGLGYPTGLTFDGATASSALLAGGSGTLASPESALVAPFNWDRNVNFVYTGGSDKLVLSTTPTELFTMNFIVAPGVAGGTEFELVIVNPPTPQAGSLNFAGTGLGDPLSAIDALGPGKITIPVPEPSTAWLALLGLTGIVTRRWRVR